jgi:hypothetical protein
MPDGSDALQFSICYRGGDAPAEVGEQITSIQEESGKTAPGSIVVLGRF